MGDLEKTRNNCVLTERPRACAIKAVLELARNDVGPMTYLRSRPGRYDETKRYIALHL